MLAMEVSITASTASVKLTVILMPTQLVRLPLELITAMALSLDMEPLVTVAMLAMEVSMVATEVIMASVRLTLMPTPLARLPTACLWPMPTLLAILTTLELSPELIIPATEVMLDMEVTLDTSTDKYLRGHCPFNIFAQLFYFFLMK